MSLLKVHHGIQKSTALQDYEAVKQYCVLNHLPVHTPTGEHWHKVEDATALMLESLDSFPYYLNRGFSYYKSL
jgi:hypothetical protein